MQLKIKLFKPLFEELVKLTKYDINKIKLGIAVSGGPDSMALCWLINKIYGKQIFVKCFTVDHCIRKESHNEVMMVHEYLKSLSIEHEILKSPWSSIPKHSKLEEEAREMRYNLIKSSAVKYNLTHFLFAHHMDDNVETFLLRFYRNSGNYGLSSIPSCRLLTDNCFLLRPLLYLFNKKDLLNICKENQISYAIDQSNYDTKYDRNRIRTVLSTFNNTQYSTLNKTIELFKKYISILQLIVAEKMKKYCSFNNSFFYCSISTEIINENEIILKYILRDIIQYISCAAFPAIDEHIYKSISSLKKKKNSQCQNCNIGFYKDIILVYKSPPSKLNSLKLIVKNKKEIFDKRFIIYPHPLVSFEIRYPNKKDISSLWLKVKNQIGLHGIMPIIASIPILTSKELDLMTLCLPSFVSNVSYNNIIEK